MPYTYLSGNKQLCAGFCLVYCLFYLLVLVKAQSDSVFIRKIADEIFQHRTAYSNLHTLTKSIGPRLSGSPQTYTAEKWGQEALNRAGADRVYLAKSDDSALGKRRQGPGRPDLRKKPTKSGSYCAREILYRQKQAVSLRR